MSGPEQASVFFSLLTVFAQLAVFVWIALTLLAQPSSRGAVARFRARIAASVGPMALWLAVLVAGTCMTGSLYFSEVADFTPCKLCWFQRVCMYALVPILAIGAIRGDRNVRPYATSLALIGAPISAYHYMLERFPNLEAGACDTSNPCTIVWFWRFHYISLPMMALTGFAAVLMLLSIHRTSEVAHG